MVADPRGALINIYLLQGTAFRFGRGWYIAGAEPLADPGEWTGDPMQSGASGGLVTI
jgi:hypothetical protein